MRGCVSDPVSVALEASIRAGADQLGPPVPVVRENHRSRSAGESARSHTVTNVPPAPAMVGPVSSTRSAAKALPTGSAFTQDVLDPELNAEKIPKFPVGEFFVDDHTTMRSRPSFARAGSTSVLVRPLSERKLAAIGAGALHVTPRSRLLIQKM